MTQKTQEEDIVDIVQQYADEYFRDTYVDELKLNEMTLKVPGIKGKWATYKSINRAKLHKLIKQKQELLDSGIEMIKQKRESEGNPVSFKGAENILRNTKKFKELQTEIDRLTILTDYFQDALDCIKSMNWDVKNIIEAIKLDEM
jgi:hypothetical protein